MNFGMSNEDFLVVGIVLLVVSLALSIQPVWLLFLKNKKKSYRFDPYRDDEPHMVLEMEDRSSREGNERRRWQNTM